MPNFGGKTGNWAREVKVGQVTLSSERSKTVRLPLMCGKISKGLFAFEGDPCSMELT